MRPFKWLLRPKEQEVQSIKCCWNNCCTNKWRTNFSIERTLALTHRLWRYQLLWFYPEVSGELLKFRHQDKFFLFGQTKTWPMAWGKKKKKNPQEVEPHYDPAPAPAEKLALGSSCWEMGMEKESVVLPLQSLQCLTLDSQLIPKMGH